MAAQLDPAFLVQWVRAEVEDEPGLFEALCSRAQADSAVVVRERHGPVNIIDSTVWFQKPVEPPKSWSAPAVPRASRGFGQRRVRPHGWSAWRARSPANPAGRSPSCQGSAGPPVAPRARCGPRE